MKLFIRLRVVPQSCWCLGHIVKSQSEEVVLEEEASVEWLQYESLSVSMRLVLVGLKRIDNVNLMLTKLEALLECAQRWKRIQVSTTESTYLQWSFPRFATFYIKRFHSLVVNSLTWDNRDGFTPYHEEQVGIYRAARRSYFLWALKRRFGCRWEAGPRRSVSRNQTFSSNTLKRAKSIHPTHSLLRTSDSPAIFPKRWWGHRHRTESFECDE